MDTLPYRMPPLTKDLLDSIIFAMEDQENSYYLDLKKGFLVRDVEIGSPETEDQEEEGHDPKRYIDTPEWEPSDGFHLMELFANRVRNPLYRHRLLEALESGKGVFRKFKDALSGLPVLERKWFSFKEEHLKRIVISWYREQKELMGMIDLGEEVDDLTEELLLEDFTLEEYEGLPTDEMETFIQLILEELEAGEQFDQIASLLISRRLENELPEHYHLARNTDGSLAGMIAYTPLSDRVIEVSFFAVKKEFRGLGLFRLLFDTFSRQMARFHYPTIIVDLAGSSIVLERLFSQYGAKPMTMQLVLSCDTWNSRHPSTEHVFV